MSMLRPPRVIKPNRAKVVQVAAHNQDVGQDAPVVTDEVTCKVSRPIHLQVWLSIIAVAIAAIALWRMGDAQMAVPNTATPQSFVYRVTRAEWPQEPTLGDVFDRYPMDSRLKLATRALNGGNGQCKRLDERMPYGTEIIIATSSEGAERCMSAMR